MVAYRLELPEQLSHVHSTLYVSNLKKCLSDKQLAISLDEIHIDEKLNFIEEPVEIMDREVKHLKQSRIPIVKGKLNPRYIGPFKIIAKVGTVAYRLELPEQLSRVHNMFHVSNLKKYLPDKTLSIPLDGIQIDEKLYFIKEPVKIMDREAPFGGVTIELMLLSQRGIAWDCDIGVVYEELGEGASLSTIVEEGEPADSTGAGASSTRNGEATLARGE
nr:reverse transcriptase domain-containing protein [Tanacetum cinerariifolium]